LIDGKAKSPFFKAVSSVMGNGFVEPDPGYPRPLIDVCRHLFARSLKGA
jgi:hypothetical protein